MNYCIHLKKRKNKPYCNILKQEIPFSQCRECGNKEYKNKLLQKSQSSAESNNHQIKKKSTLKGKSPTRSGNKTHQCNQQYSKAHNNKKMRVKSKKLAKLEHSRYSVFTDDLEHCILCGKPREHLHEIIYGKNRINSIKHNFVIPLCANHHTGKEGIHFNKDLDLYYKRLCQIYFENNIGNRIEFIKIFGRSYL